jgi:hypothetical protein
MNARIRMRNASGMFAAMIAAEGTLLQDEVDSNDALKQMRRRDSANHEIMVWRREE